MWIRMLKGHRLEEWFYRRWISISKSISDDVYKRFTFIMSKKKRCYSLILIYDIGLQNIFKQDDKVPCWLGSGHPGHTNFKVPLPKFHVIYDETSKKQKIVDVICVICVYYNNFTSSKTVASFTGVNEGLILITNWDVTCW